MPFCILFCLTLAYCAERFLASPILRARISRVDSLEQRTGELYIKPLWNAVFFISVPMFLPASLKGIPPYMSHSIIWFSVLLAVVAILTKVVGCGLGAKMCGFTNRESMQVGCGMVSRGEVALISPTRAPR